MYLPYLETFQNYLCCMYNNSNYFWLNHVILSWKPGQESTCVEVGRTGAGIHWRLLRTCSCTVRLLSELFIICSENYFPEDNNRALWLQTWKEDWFRDSSGLATDWFSPSVFHKFLKWLVVQWSVAGHSDVNAFFVLFLSAQFLRRNIFLITQNRNLF